MEPTWTKQIPSSVICDTYYVFFVLYAVIFSVVLFNAAYTLFLTKGLNPALKIVLFLMNGIMASFAVTLMLFMYLMCDRALIAPQQKHEGFVASMLKKMMK